MKKYEVYKPKMRDAVCSPKLRLFVNFSVKTVLDSV